MTAFGIALFAALGAIIASFAGVAAGRLATGQSIVRGRSKCDACGATLPPAALAPVFSYLASGGRARCCGARLSALAPLSELALALLFALSYVRLGLSSVLPPFLLALAALFVLVLYDAAHHILPPVPLGVFLAASALAEFLRAPALRAFGPALLAAALIAALLALISLFSRGRLMGLSDAPLAFGLALLAAPYAVSGFVYSFWIGAAVGIIVLAGRPRGSRMGIEVPFAPFLAAGFLLAFFTQWDLFTLLLGH